MTGRFRFFDSEVRFSLKIMFVENCICWFAWFFGLMLFTRLVYSR
jgi:hypothetical protein